MLLFVGVAISHDEAAFKGIFRRARLIPNPTGWCLRHRLHLRRRPVHGEATKDGVVMAAQGENDRFAVGSDTWRHRPVIALALGEREGCPVSDPHRPQVTPFRSGH